MLVNRQSGQPVVEYCNSNEGFKWIQFVWLVDCYKTQMNELGRKEIKIREIVRKTGLRVLQ